MWASNNSHASDTAEVAGEGALGALYRTQDVHVASPAASGRIAMAVYHAVFEATTDPGQAGYWADWWATDGGDLEGVPDGTPFGWEPEAPRQCDHPGVFARGPVPGTEYCGYCDRDIPRKEL